MRYQSFYPFSSGGRADGMPGSFPPQARPFNMMQGQGGYMGPGPGPGPGGGRFGAGGTPFGGRGGGPSRLESFMGTADKFLTTAQQLSPIISQLSPMMQNIPALWQIYRGFSGSPAAGQAPAATGGTSSAAPAPSRPQPASGGQSVPRIFQPPL